MRNDVRGAARLVADLVRVVAGGVATTERAVADRVFSSLGPLPGPVRPMHHAVAGVTGAGIQGISGLVGAVAGVVATLAPAPSRTLDGSVVGSGVVAALNGILGAQLAGNPDLELRLSLRRDGRDLHPGDLASAHPDAGGHLVVLVPGLVETEHAWRYRRSRDVPADPDYGARLHADLGATPLYVRCHTGRPVARNGAELAALLDGVLAGWPVPVTRIDLIGHSMGGLIIRSACAQGSAEWVRLVRHLVYLGTPHAGAPLARGLGRLSAVLGRAPETRAWGELVGLPGSGIHDLRVGLDAPAPPGVAEHSVVAELAGGPVGRQLGDLLVRAVDAHRDGDLLTIAPAHHFDLLNHPEVYRALRGWLTDEASGEVGSGT